MKLLQFSAIVLRELAAREKSRLVVPDLHSVLARQPLVS
jgi:hypothetical protein